MSIATRNARLMVAYRAVVLSPLYWPYMLHFTSGVRGLSALEFGLLKGLYYLVCTTAEVPCGAIADRVGRRPSLALSAAFGAVACGVIASAHDFAAFALGEILMGLSMALLSGADSALLHDAFEQEGRLDEYPAAEGRSRAAALVFCAVAFPATDVWLVRGGDPVLAYWGTAVLCGLGVVAALAMVEPAAGHRPRLAEITRGAAAELARSRRLVGLVLFGIGVFALIRGVNSVFFNPVLEGAGVAVNRFGTATVVVSLLGALCAWLAPRTLGRSDERWMLAAIALGLLGVYGGLAAVSAPGPVVALLCVQGAAHGAQQPVLAALLNRASRASERRATLLSLESMASRIAWAGIVVFTGWALDELSLSAALIATAALAALPLAISAVLLAPRDRISSRRAAEPESR